MVHLELDVLRTESDVASSFWNYIMRSRGIVVAPSTQEKTLPTSVTAKNDCKWL